MAEIECSVVSLAETRHEMATPGGVQIDKKAARHRGLDAHNLLLSMRLHP